MNKRALKPKTLPISIHIVKSYIKINEVERISTL